MNWQVFFGVLGLLCSLSLVVVGIGTIAVFESGDWDLGFRLVAVLVAMGVLDALLIGLANA